jgi:hypothetical protein
MPRRLRYYYYFLLLYVTCIAAFCVMLGLGVAELAYPCLIDIRIHTTPFRNKMMSRR